MEALGFLSPGGVKPWGRVTADETERIFLAQYDNIYVTFEKDRKVKPGDIFYLYRESDDLDHPITKKKQLDIEAAKHHIDMLEMLDAKTSGNLSDEEKKLLDSVLYELRMRYVQLS